MTMVTRIAPLRTAAVACLVLVFGTVGALLPPAAAAAAPALVVADLQVRELTPGQQYLVQVRSTTSQPFDVLPDEAGTVRVRLHGARLGAPGGIEAAGFGTVSLEEEAADAAVVLRIDLTDPGYRVRVGQGGNASVVEVRISR